MTDLSANTAPICNFESALKIAAEFFAQQQQMQQLQQSQPQQQHPAPVSLNQPAISLYPHLRCRQQTNASQQAISLADLHQQHSIGQQSQLGSTIPLASDQLSRTPPPMSSLALLHHAVGGQQHPPAATTTNTNAAMAFHAHLLLQSQVS